MSDDALMKLLVHQDRIKEAAKELLEVVDRAMILSYKYESFRLHAMEPMHAAIADLRAALKGDKQ